MIDNGILLRVARALETISRTMTEEQTERKLISMESKDHTYAICWQIIKWVSREADVNIKVAAVLRKDYREGSRTADVVIERLANNAEQFLADFHQFVCNIVGGESEKEADE